MKATMHIQLVSAIVVAGLIFLLRSLNVTQALADRPSTTITSERVIVLPQTVHAPTPVADTNGPHQDPFVAQIDDDSVGVQQAIASPANVASTTASAIVTAPILHGVVIGTHSYALLRDGDEERVVSVGDNLGTSKIVAITLHGVDLSDGTHLHANTQGS